MLSVSSSHPRLRAIAVAILFFLALRVRCVNLPKLWIVKVETDLLNQRHALHENSTRYGYHCISRSR